MADLSATSHWNPYLAIAGGLLVGGGAGLLNGALVTFLRLPAFIVTLGTYGIAFALVHLYSQEQTVSQMPSEILFFGKTFPFLGADFTIGTVAMLALFVVAWFVLSQTSAGRRVYALGDNPEAVRLSGVHVTRLALGIYATAGLLYGIAGLLLDARLESINPNADADQNNLLAITAVVLGGTSLFGGRGTVIGTLIGALIASTLYVGLQLMGVEGIYQVLITGILVIVAVALDQLTRQGGRRA